MRKLLDSLANPEHSLRLDDIEIDDIEICAVPALFSVVNLLHFSNSCCNVLANLNLDMILESTFHLAWLDVV